MILDKVKLGEAAAVRQPVLSPSKVHHTKNMSILEKIKSGQKLKINEVLINKVSEDGGIGKGSTNGYAKDKDKTDDLHNGGIELEDTNTIVETEKYRSAYKPVSQFSLTPQSKNPRT